MAYGILRVRNLHASNLRDCEKHNFRQYEPGKIPDNINQEKMSLNENWIVDELPTIAAAIEEKTKDVSKRKNSVVAIEMVLGASKEFYSSGYNVPKFLKHCIRFVSKKYGKENIVSFSAHFDESNPHIHIIFLPIIKKNKRWKNKNGQGERIERSLCARDITGGPEKLRALQTEYYEHIKPIGEEAGVTFYRGTLAEEQLRQYSKQTDHRLANFTYLIAQIGKQLATDKKKKLELMAIEEAKKLVFAKNEKAELEKRVAQHINKNKGTNWQKGFSPW